MSHRGTPAGFETPTSSTNGAQEEQLYSIGGAVAELQRYFPDVSHSSLRFLEREGLLQPVRTEGGHRKFRASDLERVRTIKEWQAQHLSLEEVRQRLEIMERMPEPGELWQRYLDLAMAGRVEEAAAAILNADEAGVPLVTLFQDVLAPALVKVGEGWAEGKVTVGQEHEVSELTRDLIADLSARHAGRGDKNLTVLAACVEGELHELGLRMVSGLLRQRGVRIHFLGANVATSFLVESVRMREPDAVVLSLTIPEHQPALMEAIRALREALPPQRQPIVVVGGALGALPEESASRLGNIRVLSGTTMEQAIQEIVNIASEA